MTYIVPNYFIQNKYKNLVKIDELFCLNYITKSQNDFVDARNTMHSMNILLEGSKVIHTTDEDVTISSNEICFLTQNNYYMSERMTRDSKYKSMIIYFDDKFIFEFVKKYKIMLQTQDSKNLISVNYKHDGLFTNSVLSFVKYLEKKLDTNLLKLKIEEILLHTLRVDTKAFSTFINAVLSRSSDRILYLLESNVDIMQSLDDMCTLSRLTPNQLRRYIKKNCDTTPKLWLDTKRLEKARLMLTNTDKSITEIASECGYANISWFISQFKKQYKQTPKEFRYKM